ncbi:Uncharacterised protein [Actinobacillus pleuropneumoniae]|nr:Uncharacterised protein [Actinobacillus pleuropneumoniae]
MDIFASGNPEFNRLIQQMVRKADQVDFLDKLLRDQMVTVLRNERKEKEYFIDTFKTVRDEINRHLQIAKTPGIPPMKESLIDAANYSLEGGWQAPETHSDLGNGREGIWTAGILPSCRC